MRKQQQQCPHVAEIKKQPECVRACVCVCVCVCACMCVCVSRSRPCVSASSAHTVRSVSNKAGRKVRLVSERGVVVWTLSFSLSFFKSFLFHSCIRSFF